jgi:threonine/homoserine/homoserine lactone efflux protein
MPLFVGFLSGLVLVMPVGPTTLSIVGIGTERGRRAALAGASGVVTADLLMLPLAVLGAGAVTALSPTVLHSCEVVIGLVLLGIAAVGLLKTEEARVAVSRIRRPAPTLLAINLCNPMALASWAGLILALPDSLREPGNLLPFTIGVVIASAVWHTMLALLAGSLGRRMAEAGRRRLIRISSVALGIVGVVLVA